MNELVPVVAWVGAVLAALSSFLLFGRMRIFGMFLGRGGSDTKISVIIPARDEEANLGKLLPMLNEQHEAVHEVIVVNDHSQDGTADVVHKHGATLLESKELPEGWYGKSWACAQGARAATGDWLLFLDADVEPGPDTVTLMKSSSAEWPDAVISVCPWHRMERPYEQLSVFFNLLMIGGVGAFTWKGATAPQVALFGQVLLIKRELYKKTGGHELVKGELLENFCLGRELENMGIERRCFLGGHSIAMRMFPSGFASLLESWTKAGTAGATSTSKGILILSSLWLTGLMFVSTSLFLVFMCGPSEIMSFATCSPSLTPASKRSATISTSS